MRSEQTKLPKNVHAALGVVALLGAGLSACAGSYRLDRPAGVTDAPVRVLSLLWTRALTDPQFLEFKPQEWASAAFGPDGVVFLGSSARRFEALRMRDGQVLWVVYTDGAVASEPLYHAPSETVYFGANDGQMYAVDARTGAVRWRYKTQGTVNRRPVYDEGLLFFATSESRIYALDARTGKWRWQYDREPPEGFTIHGYSGVRVVGQRAYVGFPDGIVACLKAGSGEVVWTRSLAGEATQFVDVDVTPELLDAGTLVTAGHATGVHALDTDTGSVKWQYPVTGSSGLTVDAGQIYVTAPREGVVALDAGGRPLWRQAMPEGVPTSPVIWGRHLFVSTTETGLFVASARTGRLLQYFGPGRGISAPVSIGDGRLVVLGNSGTVFAFDLDQAL